jgi:hypothetical protein
MRLAPLIALPALFAWSIQDFHGTTARVTAIAGSMLATVVVNAVAVRYLEGSRMTLRDGQLAVANAFRGRLVNPAGPIVRIVDTDFEFARFSGRGSHLWLFVDARGHAVLRIYPEFWEPVDLERLRVGLDVPLEVRSRTATAACLRREFLGAMPWWQAHVVLVTIV